MQLVVNNDSAIDNRLSIATSYLERCKGQGSFKKCLAAIMQFLAMAVETISTLDPYQPKGQRADNIWESRVDMGYDTKNAI